MINVIVDVSKCYYLMLSFENFLFSKKWSQDLTDVVRKTKL